jgi:hypothetical protein
MQEVRIGIAGDQGQRLSQSCRAWTRSSAILIPLLFEDSWKPQKVFIQTTGGSRPRCSNNRRPLVTHLRRRKVLISFSVVLVVLLSAVPWKIQTGPPATYQLSDHQTFSPLKEKCSLRLWPPYMLWWMRQNSISCSPQGSHYTNSRSCSLSLGKVRVNKKQKAVGTSLPNTEGSWGL